MSERDAHELLARFNLSDAAYELVAPGARYEVVEQLVDGATMRVFAQAPSCLAALYREAAHQYTDDTLFVYEEERYTFAQAWENARRVASGLRMLGVKPGDRVGIAMRNYPEWVWAFMGATSLGAVVVAMNAWWTGEEMVYGIRDSGLRTLVVDRERLEHVAPYLEEIALDVVAVRTEHLSGQGVIGWDQLIEAGDAAFAPEDIASEERATILYTSGSTAHPKGVVSTHRALIHAVIGAFAAAALARAGQAPKPRPYPPAMILTVPLFHVTGLVVQLAGVFRLWSKAGWHVQVGCGEGARDHRT